MSEHKRRQRQRLRVGDEVYSVHGPNESLEPAPPFPIVDGDKLPALSEEHMRRVGVEFDNDWITAMPIRIDPMGVVFKPDGSIWISNFTLHINEQRTLHLSDCRRFRFDDDLLRMYYNLDDALSIVPPDEATAMREQILDNPVAQACRARALTHA